MSIKATRIGCGWFSLEVSDGDGTDVFVVKQQSLTDLMDWLLATGTCPPGWTVVRTPADKEPEFDDPPTKTVTTPRTCATCKHNVTERRADNWRCEVRDTATCHRNPPPWQSVKEYDHCGEWGAK